MEIYYAESTRLFYLGPQTELPRDAKSVTPEEALLIAEQINTEPASDEAVE